MKICMFSPFTSHSAGTQRLRAFGREFIKKGHDVIIVLPSIDRHSKFQVETSTEIDGIRLFRSRQLHLRRLEANMLSYIPTAALHSLSLKSDVLHVEKATPIAFPGYLNKCINHTPLVQDIEDLDHEVMMHENHPPSRVFITKLCERIIPDCSNHIVTCSTFLKNMYLHWGVPEDKLTIVPQGVNVANYEVKPDFSLKSKYNLKEHVVVYLGALNNCVQVAPLINAMKLVAANRKDTSLLIIGDGKARHSYEQLVSELDLTKQVSFAGFVPEKEKPQLLSISDVGFMCFPPSLPPAGGATKVFEYMASGIPAIVNASGDLPYYTDYGKAGAISSLDPHSLSNTILTLLADDSKRKEMGRYAHEFVKDNFDWSVLADRLLGVYRDLQP
jgi:glycosyltransferase involved in cell wall biosynthesis